MANRIEFNVGYKVDKTGLNEILDSLKKVQTEAEQVKISGGINTQLEEAANSAKTLYNALNVSWNSSLQQLDLSRFNSELANSQTTLTQLKGSLESSGASGVAAYNQVASAVAGTNLQLRESNQLLQSMGTTIVNTFKWGIASSALNEMTSSIREAWSFTKELDTSLNSIMVVSGASADEMARFAEQANNAAKAMGASTTDYTEAALLFYQQGLSGEDIEARTETVLKTANITKQATDEVTENLTAVWNGYQVSAENAEGAIDVLANVAAHTASTLEELSTAMTKVASSANAMGVTEEQLVSQISTIIAATRQAPETVGQALKTVYSRLTQLQAGMDEEGATLTSYTAKMAKFGISVLDDAGHLRDMGEVIEEVGNKWEDYTREQQISIAQTMAGTRQYNNVLALFENWDQYTTTLEIANDSLGTLQEQQDTYMKSTAAHLEQLRATTESVYMDLFDTDSINSLIDALTKVLDIIDTFLSSLGGGMQTLMMLGVMAANIFSNQLSRAIEGQIQKVNLLKQNEEQLKQVQDVIESGALSTDETITAQKTADIYQQQLDRQKAIVDVKKQLGTEGYNELTNINNTLTAYELLQNKIEGINEESGGLIITHERLQEMATEENQKYEQQLQNYNQLITAKNQLVEGSEKQTLTLEQEENITSTILDVMNNMNIAEEDKTRLEKQINDDTLEELSEEERRLQIESVLNDLIEREAVERDSARVSANEMLQIVRQLGNLSEEELAALQSNTEELEKQYNTLVRQANQQKTISELIRSVTTVTMLAQQFTNIIKTINDDSLTGWQKLSQIFQSMIFTIPMIIPGIQNMVTMFSGGINGMIASLLGLETAEGAVTVAADMMWTALTGPIGWAIAGIAAATVVIIGLVQAWNADSKAAEQAAEAAKKLADASDAAAEELSNLQNAISSYDTAKEKLDECTEGTREWRDALQECNDTIIDLLDLISGLDLGDINLDDLYNFSTGELNEDILDQITDLYNTKANTAELASLYGDYNATLTQIQSDLTDTLRSVFGIGIQEYKEQIYDNLAEIGESIANNTFTEELDKLEIDISSLTNEQFETLKTSLKSLAAQANSAAEELKVISSIEVQEALIGTEYEGNDTVSIMVQNAIDGLASSIREQLQQVITSNVEEPLTRWSTASNTEFQAILQELNSIGYNFSAANNPVQRDNGELKLNLTDNASGEAQLYSLEEISDMIAAAVAINQVGDAAENASNALNNLEKNASENTAEGLINFITAGDFDDVTQAIVDSLYNAIVNAEGEISDAALASLFGIDIRNLDFDEITSELSSLLGEGYADALIEAFSNFDTAFEAVGENLRDAASEVFRQLDSSELTLAARETLANVLENALDYAGETAMDSVAKVFKEVRESDELDSFIEALDLLEDSWGTVSIYDFTSALEAAGVETDIDEDLLWQFVAAMNATGDALGTTIDTLQENYNTITGITDGLSNQDTISEDDYNTLLEQMGSGMSQFFMETLDGEYKLIAATETFQDAIREATIQPFINAQNSARETATGYENLGNAVNSNEGMVSHEDTSSFIIPWDTLAESATKYNQAISDVGYTQRDIIASQLDLAESYQSLGDATTDEIQWLHELQDSFENNKRLTLEQRQELADYDAEIIELARDEGALNEKEQAALEIDAQVSEQIAASCETIDELKAAYDASVISIEDYNRAIISLEEAARLEGLDTDEIEDYAKHLSSIAEDSEELADSLKDDEKAAKNLATQIIKMNNAVEDLNSNWDDWADMLQNSTKESQEYSDALSNTRAALSDLLDISEEFISSDLILQNMDDIALAAQGDADAIDRLRAAALEDIIVQIALDNDINWDDVWEELGYNLSDLQAFLDENLLEVGASIDDIGGADAFIDQLNALIDATSMTSDQVQAMLSAMGYSATFEEETQEVPASVPVTTTTHEITNISYQTVHTKQPSADSATGYTMVDYELPTWTTRETSNTEYEEVDGMQTAFASQIQTEGGYSGGGSINGSAHVSNITKKATGASNNASSRNAGGNPKSSGSGGSGGSGSSPKGSSGSGSGSDTAQEPDQEDYLEDEIDRYHDINLRLKAISTSLNRLQGQENKLLGTKLLDNLNSQLATLNDQIDATNEKIAIARGELSEYRTQLVEQGVTFDSEGYITNYATIVQSQLDSVNAAVDKYNAMSAEAQEGYKDTLDQIKQGYQDFIDMISDYDTLLSETIPELEDDIQDALDQEIQIQIQKFTMEIEIRLDMSEAERDWNEFYRRIILGINNEDILGGAIQDLADILSYFNTTATDITDLSTSNLSNWAEQITKAITEGGTGSIQALTDQVNNTLNQLAQIDASGWSSVYGDNQSQALEDLQTYYEELMSQLEDVQDLVEDIEDSYLDMIDEAIDAFDEQVDQYEYINDLLNHDINLVGLIYGDDAYEQMARYYEQIEANNNAELDFLRQRVQYAYEMMEAETDDEARKKWQEEWEDALEELNDKVEDSVENIIDKYTNVINQIISELNDAITSGLGLDYVGEEWDLMNQEADIYLDTINSLYALQDLRNKYQTAIDSTDDIAAQQKLNALMEEQLTYLEEKGELTQYDIDRAELEYEIALKQIALQEAQQNKSQMRLRRDSQGNYTYQYVSDEDAVADAQAELLSLQNDLYNLDLDAYKSNLDDLYSVYNEFQEKLLELYEDQTLSAEEREQKIALYAEYYGDIINDLTRENGYIRTNLMDSAMQDLAALYEIDVENFKSMSEEEQNELMNSLVPQWDSSIQHMADTFVGEGGFLPVCEQAFEDLNQATLDYEESLDEMAAAAGVDLESVTEGYDTASIAAQQLLSDNQQLINQYMEEVTAIQAVCAELETLISEYKSATSAANAAVAAAYGYYEATSKTSANAAASSSSNSSSSSSSSKSSSSGSSSSSSSGSSSSSSGSGSGNGSVEVGDKVLLNSGVYYNTEYGTGGSGKKYVGTGQYLYVTKIASSGSYPIHLSSENVAPTNPANKYQIGWVKKSQISGYDTGGYTGEWGDDAGMLALLHQKELVLNEHDTENLLSAVSLVRDVATMLNTLDNSVLTKLGNLAVGLRGVSGYGKEDETLEQKVHIEANFPNVNSAQEIENAFNNLVNVASQYAYNTQR